MKKLDYVLLASFYAMVAFGCTLAIGLAIGLVNYIL